MNVKNIKVSEKVTVGKNPNSFHLIVMKIKFRRLPIIVNKIPRVIITFLSLK